MADDKSQVSELGLSEWEQRHLAYQQKKLEREAERSATVDSEETPLEEALGGGEVMGVAPSGSVNQALPVIFFSAIVFLLSLFMVSPLSKQKLFQISGTTYVSDAQVIEASEIAGTDYISQTYFQNLDHMARLVANHVWIDAAQMTYEFPNRFLLTVEEAQIVAFQTSGDEPRPILSNGETVDLPEGYQMPETYLAIGLDDADAIKSLVQQLMTLDEKLRQSFLTVTPVTGAATKDLLELTTVEGHLIRVPLSELETKLPYYQDIKEKLVTPMIVDMEVGIYATTEGIESLLRQARTGEEIQAQPTVIDEEQVSLESAVGEMTGQDGQGYATIEGIQAEQGID